MKAFFLALLFIVINNPSLRAVDKEEVRVALEIERMKFRSDYPNDLNSSMKEGSLFVLWVDKVDPKLYQWLKVNRPHTVHSFIESKKLEGVQPGLVVGVRGKTMVEQTKILSSVELAKLKTEEVIPYNLGLPPGSPSFSSPLIPNPAADCSGGVESWTGFRH